MFIYENSVLIYGGLLFHKKLTITFLSCKKKASFGLGSEVKRNTSFDRAEVFIIVIFPIKERLRCCQIFNKFCIFFNCGFIIQANYFFRII